MPGSPLGPPDLVSLVAPLRYVLVLLAGFWALRIARGRSSGALGVGITFVGVAAGFWVFSLGRPYGLLVDAEATRRAALVAVAGATGRADEGFLVGEEAASSWASLAARGVPAAVLHWIPTVLPLLLLPAVGLLIGLLWKARDRAAVAALLWLAFSTGDLDTLRGAGVLGGLWTHPAPALAAVGLLAVVLVSGRLLPPTAGVGVSLALVIGGGVVLLRGATSWGAAGALQLLTLDSVPWSPLAAFGLRRRPDGASLALVVGGAALVLAGALGAPIDGWGAHLLYRLGILLAASGPVAELAARAGALGSWPSWAGTDPARRGLAALVLVAVPGCFLTWWNPRHLDPVAERSLEPLSRPLLRVAIWIREETPPTAVFLASADYAPSVAALAGRRVLRAPTLATPSDDERRLRLERALIAIHGRAPEALLRRYGLTHVLVAPGDFREHGLAGPEDLAARGGFRLRYADENGLRVFEIVR
jgi:hypothetical protein